MILNVWEFKEKLPVISESSKSEKIKETKCKSRGGENSRIIACNSEL